MKRLLIQLLMLLTLNELTIMNGAQALTPAINKKILNAPLKNKSGTILGKGKTTQLYIQAANRSRKQFPQGAKIINAKQGSKQTGRFYFLISLKDLQSPNDWQDTAMEISDPAYQSALAAGFDIVIVPSATVSDYRRALSDPQTVEIVSTAEGDTEGKIYLRYGEILPKDLFDQIPNNLQRIVFNNCYSDESQYYYSPTDEIGVTHWRGTMTLLDLQYYLNSAQWIGELVELQQKPIITYGKRRNTSPKEDDVAPKDDVTPAKDDKGGKKSPPSSNGKLNLYNCVWSYTLSTTSHRRGEISRTFSYSGQEYGTSPEDAENNIREVLNEPYPPGFEDVRKSDVRVSCG